jgi:hypothetical protein
LNGGCLPREFVREHVVDCAGAEVFGVRGVVGADDHGGKLGAGRSVIWMSGEFSSRKENGVSGVEVLIVQADEVVSHAGSLGAGFTEEARKRAT